MPKIIAFFRRHWVIATSLLVIIVVSLTLLLSLRQKGDTTSLLGSFILSASENLRSENGRTNMLLLGIGGGNHESPNLTDSMLFVSINHETRKVVMISLPRDIWVDSLGARINTAYEKGEEEGKKQGKDLVKSVVSQAFNQPIHYVFVLDFAGFTRLIDTVGGLDINVDRAFDDYKYPVPGLERAEPESSRYEHLSFNAGLTHMDGALALKYARSRHAVGDEGTDFARSRRQQKILLAFREKVFSTKVLLSPSTIRAMAGDLQSSVDTDIKPEEYASFLKLFIDINNPDNPIVSGNIENFLYNPPASRYNGAWVLIPKNSWEEIHAYVKELLE